MVVVSGVLWLCLTDRLSAGRDEMQSLVSAKVFSIVQMIERSSGEIKQGELQTTMAYTGEKSSG